MNVVGLCGSLRAASLNLAALKAAGKLMPEGMSLSIVSFRDIPVYSADDQALSWPPQVVELADRVRKADAIVISSPEYNFSIPGGLKNALDWISRVQDQPFKGKPVAIMGASPGPVGTARMQYDLRKVLHFLEADTLLKPEVFIGQAANKFDADGEIVDSPTRAFITQQMSALGDLVRRRK